MSAATKLFHDERDYPFDPSLKLSGMGSAVGLERLRYIPDRSLAQAFYVTFEAAQRNDRTGAARAFERQQERDEQQKLRALAESSLDGKRGHEMQNLAEHMLIDDTQFERPMRDDLASLREFQVAAQRIRGAR